MTPRQLDECSPLDHGQAPSFSQQLRDLQWSLESPSLLSGDEGPLTACPQPNWKSHQDALLEFLEKRLEHRVGRYFENLVQFWIEHLMGYRLLTHNEQIFHQGKTMGEIDFVFQTPDRDIIHCETAVKFYLFHDSETSLGSHFIGPNTSDTLERKIDRLFNWQLPLGKTHVPEATQHIAHVKGRIFYHPKQSAPLTVPEHLSQEHLKGTWIKASEWDHFCKSGIHRFFRILRKPHWLAEQIYDSENTTATFDGASFKEQLAQHFSRTDHSLMVSAFDSDQPNAIESQRIFVVADHWPKPLASSS